MFGEGAVGVPRKSLWPKFDSFRDKPTLFKFHS